MFGVPMFGESDGSERWVIRPSAYALLGDAGRIAVVRSRDGVFLPGGGIEGEETPAQAIERECLEECGFLVVPGSWTTRAVQWAYSPSERSHFEKRSTFQECAIAGPDASRQEAGHELLWLDSAAAQRTLSHPSHGWAVERWIERLRGRA